MLIPSQPKSGNRRKVGIPCPCPGPLFNQLWSVICLRQKPVKSQWTEKKNRPQDNFKWEIKSGGKPCQNLLKNRFFSFKNVIKNTNVFVTYCQVYFISSLLLRCTIPYCTMWWMGAINHFYWRTEQPMQHTAIKKVRVFWEYIHFLIKSHFTYPLVFKQFLLTD